MLKELTFSHPFVGAELLLYGFEFADFPLSKRQSSHLSISQIDLQQHQASAPDTQTPRPVWHLDDQGVEVLRLSSSGALETACGRC